MTSYRTLQRDTRALDSQGRLITILPDEPTDQITLDDLYRAGARILVTITLTKIKVRRIKEPDRPLFLGNRGRRKTAGIRKR